MNEENKDWVNMAINNIPDLESEFADYLKRYRQNYLSYIKNIREKGTDIILY